MSGLIPHALRHEVLLRRCGTVIRKGAFLSYGPVSAPRHSHAAARTGWHLHHQTWRATIIFLTSAIALAGFRPFGQAFAQFMMVWQR